MIQSMTGFASASLQAGFGSLTWEIRSVNHRYLEIGLRIPEEFRPLEPAIRETLRERLGRGKVDAGLRFVPGGSETAARMTLNAARVQRLAELHRELQGLLGLDQEVDADEVLRWPGVVQEEVPDTEPLHAAALKLLASALEEMQAARGREGRRLVELLLERLDGIERQIALVRQWLPEIRSALRERLLTRIADLPQPLDPGRLEQEVAFLVQKMDVDEELDRLAAHAAETRRVLTLREPVGRRLDFLLQEFNRESNTLSSKSVDQRTTQAAVELKVLIEQMREQAQNIE